MCKLNVCFTLIESLKQCLIIANLPMFLDVGLSVGDDRHSLKTPFHTFELTYHIYLTLGLAPDTRIAVLPRQYGKQIFL